MHVSKVRPWLKQAATFLWLAVQLTAPWNPTDVTALPTGRDWAPTDTFKVIGHTWVGPDLFDLDSSGAPYLVAAPVGGIGQDAAGFRWADSTWVQTWSLGYGTAFIKIGDAPLGRYTAVWQGVQPIGPNGNLVTLETAEFFEDRPGPVDTIAIVQGSNFLYARADYAARRWVAKDDFGNLRLWRSDAPGQWQELEIPGVASDGLALAAIDDSTVLVVFAWSREGIRWGYMRGTTWEEGAPRLTLSPLAGGVKLRRHPDGGYWAGWATKDEYYNIVRFKDGIWGPVDTLRCTYRTPPPVYYASSSSYLSRDPYPYPVVPWSSFGTNGSEVLCVCVPTDDGFTVAEEIDGSIGALTPIAVRDRNEDSWVAWWKFFDGMFFTHTYTRATSTAPRVEGSGSHRTIRWTLSEPAPETWWAVMAARNDGEFEEVARARAGESLDMECDDPSPPAGIIRYRIRREHVNVRYQWLSPETRWPPHARRPLAVHVSPQPALAATEFEVVEAVAGPIELRVFDLQGRVVHRTSSVAAGTGRDRIVLPAETVSAGVPGVYFITVRDASGQVSAAKRIVVLQ